MTGYVAIAAIKSPKTANEIASEFGVHSFMVNRWKKQAFDFMVDIFDGEQEKTAKDVKAEKDSLYQQIGKFQFEVEWLKKIPDFWH